MLAPGSDQTSSGTTTTTGPGVPDSATRSALAQSSGARRGSRSSSTALVTPANMLAQSSSWKARRPISDVRTWPTIRSSGVASRRAVCTPMLALVAPGPRLTRHTPARPVSLASATAMKVADPSWRQVTTSTGASWSASSAAR